MNNSHFIIAFFALLLFSLSAGAQSYRIFHIETGQAGLTFRKPAKLIEKDTTIPSDFFVYIANPGPHTNKFIYPLNYRLTDQKQDLLVGFIVLNIDTKKDSDPILHAIFPTHTANTDYLLKIRMKGNFTSVR